jgi:dihydrofolate synthase/folylpolyglutamate synthase
VFTCTAPTPRGLPSGDIAAAARTLGADAVIECDTVEQACDRAIRAAGHDDAVLVSGSLYVVGAARPYLHKIV